MASAAGDAGAPPKAVEQVAPPVKVEEKKTATVEDEVDDVPDPDEDDLDDLDGESFRRMHPGRASTNRQAQICSMTSQR
jgi:hypothetical protein